PDAHDPQLAPAVDRARQEPCDRIVVAAVELYLLADPRDDAEPFVRIVPDPDGPEFSAAEFVDGCCLALLDHRDVWSERRDRVDLLAESAVAVPRDDAKRHLDAPP